MSGLFAFIVLSVWISEFHQIVAFLFSMTFGGLCSHQLLSCGRPKWSFYTNVIIIIIIIIIINIIIYLFILG